MSISEGFGCTPSFVERLLILKHLSRGESKVAEVLFGSLKGYQKTASQTLVTDTCTHKDPVLAKMLYVRNPLNTPMGGRKPTDSASEQAKHRG